MRLAFLLLLLVSLSNLLGSCRSASNDHLYLQARADDDCIAVGDTVSIVDRMRPDVVMASARVGEDGEMEFPGIGRLGIAGQSELELAAALRSRYGAVYGNTDLNVSVARSENRFYVYGEVVRPGRYTLAKGQTALEGVMDAGPDSSYADLSKVRLLRAGDDERRGVELNVRRMLRGDTQFNLALENGDILYVPSTAVGRVLSPMMPTNR
ncbi:MAG: polysaccharide biosynthesis/export family protein [Planctomycetota bacterium]